MVFERVILCNFVNMWKKNKIEKSEKKYKLVCVLKLWVNIDIESLWFFFFFRYDKKKLF